SRQDTALDHLREATLTPTSTPNQKEKAARERLTDVRRRAKAMNFRPVRIILLCTTTVLCPAVLFGQAEPGSLPENSAQPAQSSQPMPGPGRQQATRPSMQDSIGSSGQTAQAAKDKMFVRKAIEGGLAQVHFGQLAAQKGGSDDVKTLGQHMVEEHTALNKDLEEVADSM